MPGSTFKILVIEDNTTMREGVVEALTQSGYSVAAMGNGEEGLSFIKKHRPDLVITDYKMNPVDGLAVLRNTKEFDASIEVILITAFGTVDVAVDAMKDGAADFLTKPFRPDELTVKVEKILKGCLQRRQLEKTTAENEYLREAVREQFQFSEIIGSSPRMLAVYDLVKKSAESGSTVAIYGESGTGKELIARAIHENSSRKDRPFIKVHCAALTESLLESELFGHEKGAFTGAIKSRKGRFELADSGTLFLDEIGDISPNVQVKLLRAIQEQEFERVGGEVTLRVDTRIITATNKNLQDSIKKGLFREDLYYRLHIIPITVPSLRDRKEDIPKLVDFFVGRLEVSLAKPKIYIDSAVYDFLRNYEWPGNVRELENVIERAVVLSGNNKLTLSDFDFMTRSHDKQQLSLEEITSLGLEAALERIEKSLIEQALSRAGGGRSEAARILGVKTSAFYYKLEKYGLM